MGKIEEVIFSNYRKAIEDGNLDQAKKAVELAGVLRTKIELEGFIDYDLETSPIKAAAGKFFNPFPYKYFPEKCLVEIGTASIILTQAENNLFYLFSQNETSGPNVIIIPKEKVHKHLWGDKPMVPSALRISIFRLRQKIEADPKHPQILLNYYNRGYVFLGKKFDLVHNSV